MNKIRKICAAVFCGVIIIVCCMFGFREPPAVVVENHCPYPVLESYSARVVDAVPESFRSEYIDEMLDDGGKVVEVTWNFTNSADKSVIMKYVWIDYECSESRIEWLYALEEKKDWRTAGDDPEILPPGEHITVREYVMVLKGMREIKASLGADYGSSEEERIPREEVVLTF